MAKASKGGADAASGAVAPPAPVTPTFAVEIGLQLQVDLPRSAATDTLPPIWTNPTPGVQASRVWLQPAVIVGRRQVFVGDQSIAAVTCAAPDPALCDAVAFTGPTGKQRLDLDAAAVDASGHLAALQAKVIERGWSGRPVLVFADRRLAYHAVEVVVRTLAESGAQPVLVAATDKGAVVRVLPGSGAALEPYPTHPSAPCDAKSQHGEGDGAVPDDLTGAVVHVTLGGMSLELLRKDHESVGRELVGHVGSALSQWARRIRSADAQLDHVAVLASPAAPWGEAVRAIDALRDTCAVLDPMSECHARQSLFAHIDLQLDPDPAAEPAPQMAPPPAPILGAVAPVPLRSGDLLRRDAPLSRPGLNLPRPHSGAPTPEAR